MLWGLERLAIEGGGMSRPLRTSPKVVGIIGGEGGVLE